MTQEGFAKGPAAYEVKKTGETGHIKVGERTYQVKYQGPETPPGPGVKVIPCLIEGENLENRDFADINIDAGYSSPLEWFNGPEIQITDYYLGGEGIFFAEDPNGKVYCEIFDGSPEQIGMYITFGTGWKQRWVAKEGGSGLHILESCVPPWPSELPYEKIDDPATDKRLGSDAREIYNKKVVPVLHK
jgi:hypothetical protein